MGLVGVVDMVRGAYEHRRYTRAVVIGHHTAPDPPVMLTAAVSVNTAARSIAFPSSRMFPGHSYASSRA